MNRRALHLARHLEESDSETTLGEVLGRGRYSAGFVEDFLVPMGSDTMDARRRFSEWE